MHFDAASRRERREHNAEMSIAYVAATLVMASKRPALKRFLVPEDPRPKKARPWQQLKAAIMLALGPGKDASDGR